MPERTFDQVSHGVEDARGDHVVARLGLLEHEPHRPHVVRRIPPVAPRVQVPQHELVVEPAAIRATPCATFR